ncbi:hypothetical protein J6590_041452 [Homalodisca vitripennis]|nr:hypothetical protein J6590_041452 [Homalodisca vitripennis]
MLICSRLFSFGISKGFLYKMSAATDLHLLHDNVNDSEHLITHLKAEVKQLMSLVHEKYTVTKIKELQDENNKIKNEINAVKKELIQLQIANGVPQGAPKSCEGTLVDISHFQQHCSLWPQLWREKVVCA